MQGTVHHHVRPVRGYRLAIALGLAAYDVGADHEIAQRPVAVAQRRRIRRGERQDIGGLVLAPPEAIELAAFALADDPHRDLAAFTTTTQRRRRPAAHACACRRPGACAPREIQPEAACAAHEFSEGACASYAFTIRCTSG